MYRFGYGFMNAEIQKSIRIDSVTEEVISSYEGRSFSDKLRLLCNDMKYHPEKVIRFIQEKNVI